MIWWTLIGPVIIGVIEVRYIIPLNDVLEISKRNYKKLLGFDLPYKLFFAVTAGYPILASAFEILIIYYLFHAILDWMFSVCVMIILKIIFHSDWKTIGGWYEIGMKILLDFVLMVLDDGIVWYLLWNLFFGFGLGFGLLLSKSFTVDVKIYNPPISRKQQKRLQRKRDNEIEGIPPGVASRFEDIISKLR